ncbi:glycoside hydrolase superfamily [Crucibulum laeve]|uniref:chitinase n=1 Tax=Crucibulum laeve TaxID=68775 RepID=A0A5C3M6Q9_9AGAR|nr:glycoside hydrolase superfamily [Crucibulum laeve]
MFLSKGFSSISVALFVLVSEVTRVYGYDNSRSDNLAVYWGQNSYGATHSDTANWQKPLANYCQDDTINAIPLAFLNVFFSTGGLPEINMANTCSSNGGVFPGTSLATCQSMAADIKACQAKGKIITLSLGGATGAASFTSDAQAQTFADTIWNLFLGGSSSTRPFGDAVLDGIDLDIEGGGSAGFAAFVTRIRSHASGASKKYYVTAAPQCPFPDAYLGSVLNAVGFDAVYVQVYNNYCGVQNYNNPNAWNFATWDNWAKTVSPNKAVKVYIGAPASSSAAGSGYVDATTLGNIAKQTRSQFSSFGGIMLWDASQAYGNNRFDIAIKNAMGTGTGGGSTTIPTTTTPKPPTTTTTTKPTTTTTTTKGTGSCAGVAAWTSSIAYNGGQQVTYGGHLWTAKWWTQADTPGGAAGVWTDNGACLAKLATSAATAQITAGSPNLSTQIKPSQSAESVVVSSVAKPALKASLAGTGTAAKPTGTDEVGHERRSRLFRY